MSDNNNLDVEYMANLARISLSNEEKELFQSQMGSILEYINLLDELDTEGVEPMPHAVRVENVFRDDVPVPSMERADFLKNAPAQISNLINVPKIIE